MRRVVSGVLTAVLAGALWMGVATASPATDLASAFAMQTFGRLPVEPVAFSTSSDRSLRGLAFRSISTVALPPIARIVLPEPPPLSLAFFRPISIGASTFMPASPAPVATAAYAPVSFSRFALTTPTLARPTDDTAPAFSSSLRDATTAYSTSTQVGAFQLSAANGDAELAELSARDQRLQTISSVNLGVAGRHVKLDVGSSYERLSSDVPSFQYRPGAVAKSSITDVPGMSVAQLASGFDDVTARGIDAGLAVPITRNLTVGMHYGTQRYTGAVNAQDFAPNLDTSKFSYVGNLTFALPRSSSSIVVSARQYRYLDNLAPANSTSQTRADVNFTVKF